MSSYSKQVSQNSFQKHTSCPKQPPQQLKPKEKGTKAVVLNKDPINIKVLHNSQPKPTIDNQKPTDKTFLPGRYPIASPDKSLPYKEELVKKIQPTTEKSSAPTIQLTNSTTSQNCSKNTTTNATAKTKHLNSNSSNILGGTTGNKYHPNNNNNNNNNNSNNKWRRNNFPLFYGGYPSPGRINAPSNIPFFGRGFPTDASLYFPSGICPPHYSPIHHPHIRQHHLNQQRFLALSPVTQQHPYHKYLTLNHISNLRRSRSAHGSFRSKVSSTHHQQITNR